MPKDECDPEDPMELCGVGLVTATDTSALMAECFIEEFMRLGHSAAQILALFRNPHYVGVNLVWQNRGEAFVRTKIEEVFGWWKHEVRWSERSIGSGPPEDRSSGTPRLQATELDSAGCDPMGAALPQLNL